MQAFRVQGVIIADDGRRTEPPPTPAKPKVSLRSGMSVVMSFIGKALLRLFIVAGVIALAALVAVWLVYMLPIIVLGALVGAVLGKDYDPKLVILVDDGNGGTTWVSLFAWYD